MAEELHEYKKRYQMIRSGIVSELIHGIVVSNLAYRVGKQMKFSDEDCYDLAVAGLLHDIGKLELEKYVRGMEDKTLVVEEIRYIRNHAMMGALILQEKGYSQKIVDMVKSHHENCDGSGYPLNLTREDIPIGARILRVCDVFAALTADRSYRRAFDVDTAMKLMIEESKNYDIQVFLAFMNMVHSEDMAQLLDTETLEKRFSDYRFRDEVRRKTNDYTGAQGSAGLVRGGDAQAGYCREDGQGDCAHLSYDRDYHADV